MTWKQNSVGGGGGGGGGGGKENRLEVMVSMKLQSLGNLEVM